MAVLLLNTKCSPVVRPMIRLTYMLRKLTNTRLIMGCRLCVVVLIFTLTTVTLVTGALITCCGLNLVSNFLKPRNMFLQVVILLLTMMILLLLCTYRVSFLAKVPRQASLCVRVLGIIMARLAVADIGY